MAKAQIHGDITQGYHRPEGCYPCFLFSSNKHKIEILRRRFTLTLLLFQRNDKDHFLEKQNKAKVSRSSIMLS